MHFVLSADPLFVTQNVSYHFRHVRSFHKEALRLLSQWLVGWLDWMVPTKVYHSIPSLDIPRTPGLYWVSQNLQSYNYTKYDYHNIP